MPEPIALCFSGGKDSAFALWTLQRGADYEVVRLITTVTDGYDRVSMHGVRRALLRSQADAIGIPLTEVGVPPHASNDAYERAMGEAYGALHAAGIRRVAFGDIFLADLRAYRERQLAACGLAGHFPIWRRDTAALARAFIDGGFEATTVCVDPAVLDAAFAGRPFDARFLAALPDTVDPCGENGEFHTFVSDGPVLRRPVRVTRGAVVVRDHFVFCDLLPATRTTTSRPEETAR